MSASQAVFAKWLGLSAKSIQAWEQGTKTPSPSVRRILAFINGDPAYWQRQFQADVNLAILEKPKPPKGLAALKVKRKVTPARIKKATKKAV